ncbi:hypothetical protein TWF281_003043 [Arthrobotrys megalospora]
MDQSLATGTGPLDSTLSDADNVDSLRNGYGLHFSASANDRGDRRGLLKPLDPLFKERIGWIPHRKSCRISASAAGDWNPLVKGAYNTGCMDFVLVFLGTHKATEETRRLGMEWSGSIEDGNYTTTSREDQTPKLPRTKRLDSKSALQPTIQI